MVGNFMGILAACKLFSGMSYAEIDSAVSCAKARIVSFSKGEVHTMCNEPCDYLDIVVTGELVVRMMGSSGRMMEVLKLQPGEVVAPCYLFASNRTLPASIESSCDTRVMRMSLISLMSLVDSNGRVRWNFLQVVSDTAVYMVRRIKFLSLQTVKEKVSAYLRAEAMRQSSRTVKIVVSRQRIADYFAIQKFSLLRCLADLASKGIIDIDRRTITILDFGRL